MSEPEESSVVTCSLSAAPKLQLDYGNVLRYIRAAHPPQGWVSWGSWYTWRAVHRLIAENLELEPCTQGMRPRCAGVLSMWPCRLMCLVSPFE